MKRLRAELALAGITLVWGTTFVVVKSALADLSTLIYLALRFWLAAIVLLLLYGRAIRRKSLYTGAVAGVILFLAYVFQTEGLEFTTPSKSAFLTGLSIPAVPLLNSLVYRLKPRLIDLAGIAISTAGMVLLTLPADGFGSMNRGDVLSFLCALTFALHIVVVGHFTREHGFQTLAVGQIVTVAVLSSLFASFAETPRFHMTPYVAGAVLITGLLATALAFTGQAWAQQYTSSTRAALIFSLEPPVAWLVSWFTTGERLAGRGKVGAVLILAGILLVEGTRGRFEPAETVTGEFETIPNEGASD